MKLVTFDDGKVGRVDGDESSELDVAVDARVLRARRVADDDGHASMRSPT